MGAIGFHQPWRAVQEKMVERLTPLAGSHKKHAQVVLDRLLADELCQSPRTQRQFDAVAGLAFGRKFVSLPHSARLPGDECGLRDAECRLGRHPTSSIQQKAALERFDGGDKRLHFLDRVFVGLHELLEASRLLTGPVMRAAYDRDCCETPQNG